MTSAPEKDLSGGQAEEEAGGCYALGVGSAFIPESASETVSYTVVARNPWVESIHLS